MRFATTLAAVLSLASTSSALNILLNNDDGFGSGNLRELYKLLKAAGHDVLIVAPATQQSGQGGRSDFSTYPNLTSSSQYDIVPAGAPAVGTDPNDSSIWYYNGTPAACTFVALDYVLPRYYPGWTPDLALAGPNYGTNLGPFVYSLSGTLGATYAAVSRSIPAIALSASNAAVPYFNVTNSSHPAALAAKASYAVVKQFINATAEGARVLPLGYGVNVNIPELFDDTLPPVVKSRLTGEAETDVAVYDEEKGTFTWGNLRPLAAGVNACYNGDCSLPGETAVVANGGISVSAFTIDYDAPSIPYTEMVFAKVENLFSSGEGGNETSGYRTKPAPKKRMMTGRDVYRM
ncbi:uncharacterized protein N0V89_001277 [Didymosphaeria variabile]|uniref:Survival protein SurE-like phosphatase/nucleotidase domain-containing protein n=1 Tax=Didymosphaeria variabile TaxID=1932322 RepID=A0A9W9CGL3_9PLEO|nr:uncharacterized protein N0V89_001277 [Didymosphaeria variabile]KAJ4360710.1 hypothetical protein N0V89_001277 [Didymosphaeria variabile]